MTKTTITKPKKLLERRKCFLILRMVSVHNRKITAQSHNVSYPTVKKILYRQIGVSEKSKPCINALYKKARKRLNSLNDN